MQGLAPSYLTRASPREPSMPSLERIIAEVSLTTSSEHALGCTTEHALHIHLACTLHSFSGCLKSFCYVFMLLHSDMLEPRWLFLQRYLTLKFDLSLDRPCFL